MEFRQEMYHTSRLCMPMCHREVNSDISEDITLPDYYPEIRRVLCVRERLMPPAKFISGGKVDVNGTADYTLIYISGEGTLCSAPLSAEYEFSLPIENISDFELSEGVTVMAHSVAEGSSVRVSAPRRLQLRSHIRTAVSAWGRRSCEEKIIGARDPAAVQRLVGEAVCADIICESSEPVTLEDEYRLPSEDCRVSFADGSVVIRDLRMDGEVIRITGDVEVKMLIMCDAESRSENVVRRIKFEAETELDGADFDASSALRADGIVTDLSLNVENGSVSIQANIMLQICATCNRKVNYTRDAYSIEQKGETVMAYPRLPVILENRSCRFSMGERLDTAEVNFPEGAEIVEALGGVCVDNVAVEEGKFVFTGNSRCDIICKNDGEYSVCQLKLPFRYSTDGDGDIDIFDVVAEMTELRAKRDGSVLSVDAEIFMSYTLVGGEEVEMLDSVEFSDAQDTCTGQWSVCYVSGNESAWSIAKRYGVRESDIKGDPKNDRFVMIER